MKKARNILITILSFVLLLTMAMGVVGCNGDGSGGGDEGQEVVVSLNRDRLELDQRSDAVQLKATVYVDGRTISNPELTWLSLDSNVVTVSATGVVSVVAMGETSVTCTYNETTTSCSVIVNKYYDPQFKIVVDPQSVEIPFVSGHTFTIVPQAVFTFDNTPANPVYEFVSLNTAIATVDANGLVSVVGEGTCDIKIIGTIGENTVEVYLTLTVGEGLVDGSLNPDMPW